MKDDGMVKVLLVSGITVFLFLFLVLSLAGVSGVNGGIRVNNGDLNVVSGNNRVGDERALGSPNCTTLALAALIDGNYTLLVNSDYTMTADANMPSTVSVKMRSRAKFLIDDYDLYIQGSFECDPDHQAFYWADSNASGVVYLRGNIDSIYPEWFGAVGDRSITNDTASFTHAFAACNAPLILSKSKIYYVGDLVIPEFTTIIGNSTPTYTTAQLNASDSFIMGVTGSTCVFDCESNNNITLDGVMIDGNDIAGYGISFDYPGGDNLIMKNCGIYQCSTGLNGNYAGTAQIMNCNFNENVNGVTNLVDSKIIGGYVAGNSGDGIRQWNGANSCTFENIKSEWNSGNNFEFVCAVLNQVIGGTIDRSGSYGVRALGATTTLSLIGVDLIRNYSDSNSAGAHIKAEEVGLLLMSGCRTKTGSDDGGGSYESPLNCIDITTSAETVILIGNDLSGHLDDGSIVNNSHLITNYLNSGNYGITIKKDNFGFPIIDNGMVYQDYQYSSVLDPNETETLSMSQDSIGTYHREPRTLKVVGRDSTGPDTLYGELAYVVVRDGAGASMTEITTVAESGAGECGTDGADVMYLVISNVATDGSTFDIDVNNNHATNSIQIYVYLE